MFRQDYSSESNILCFISEYHGAELEVCAKGTFDQKSVVSAFARFFKDKPAEKRDFLHDNISIHKSPLLEQVVSRRKCEIVFNAPYTPDGKPIEMTFSAWKDAMRPVINSCGTEVQNAYSIVLVLCFFFRFCVVLSKKAFQRIK